MRWQKSYQSFSKHQIALINDVEPIYIAYKAGNISSEGAKAAIGYLGNYHNNESLKESRQSNCRALSALSSLGSGINAMASSSSTRFSGALADGFAGAGRNETRC